MKKQWMCKLFVIITLLFVSINVYSMSYKERVKNDIYKALYTFEKHEKKIIRQWTPTNVNTLATVLIAIEKYVGISHKKMLSTILTESDMRIREVSPPNRNKSRDYGLTQQNSKYLIVRYASAKRLLRRIGIHYTEDLFDISVNVMSGALTLKDFKRELRDRGVEGPYCHFVAYNVGPTGYLDHSKERKKYQYLRRFKRFLIRL